MNSRLMLIVLVVCGILLFIYANSPEEEETGIIISQEQTANWTPMIISYWAGNVDGIFKGQVSNITPVQITNMTGIFAGRCYLQDMMRQCLLNISGGKFIGSYQGKLGTTNQATITNMSGYADGWNVNGRYLGPEVKPQVESKPVDLNTIIIILFIAAILYVVFKYQTKSKGWRVLGNAEISKKLKRYLWDEWSLPLRMVMDTTYIDTENPRWIHIHALLENPKFEHILIKYDLSKGTFTDLRRQADFSQIKEFINPIIRYVEEREVKRKKSGDLDKEVKK